MNEDEEFLPGGFGELLRQAQEVQEQLARAQGAAADQVVEGRAGGGAVSVTLTGAMEFQAVHIDPEAVDPNDVGMLEDLVLAAVRDAVDKSRALSYGSTGPLGGGLLGGSGLEDLLGGSGLEDLLGGAGGDLLGPLQEMLQGLMGGGTIEPEAGGREAAGEEGGDAPGGDRAVGGTAGGPDPA